MTRHAVVIRPEPGNAATVRRLAALGLTARALPLFAVEPVAWEMPEGDFDALLITSANAIRHGGASLRHLTHRPVVAVGEATARAARAAGFAVAVVGEGGADEALATARREGWWAPVHLAGRDHVEVGVPTVAVYASNPLPAPAKLSRMLADGVVLVHSARAVEHLSTLVEDRSTVRLAALSEAVATAAGTGWETIAVPAQPTDALLTALARGLAD